MASIIPQSFQKRLLRSVLSHIDLLDVDALDLDGLDIGWRTENTIRLTDVSLRHQKLASLLKLPHEWCVQDASASSLSLSIPSDLYRKPVKVDLVGVRLRVAQKTPETPLSAQTSSQAGQDDGHEKQASNERPALPTSRDLAESYLEHETPDKTAELAAEIISADPTRSVASSSEIEDDVSGYGTAAGFGLPTFLANFVASVIERLLVSSQDVTIDFEGYFSGPSIAGSFLTANSPLSRIGMRLYIRSLESENATGPASAGVESDRGLGLAQDLPRTPLKVVKFEGLELSLYSNGSVFDLWRKAMAKEHARKDYHSPTHSWNEPNRPMTTHDEPSLDKDANLSTHDLSAEDLEPISTGIRGNSGGNALSSSVVTCAESGHGEGIPSQMHSPTLDIRSPADNSVSLQNEGSSPVGQDVHSSETYEASNNLLESQVFSPHQAQSLYMSALGDLEKDPAQDSTEKQSAPRDDPTHLDSQAPSPGASVKATAIASADAMDGCSVDPFPRLQSISKGAPKEEDTRPISRRLISCDQITLSLPLLPRQSAAVESDELAGSSVGKNMEGMPGAFSTSIPEQPPRPAVLPGKDLGSAITVNAGIFEIQCDLSTSAMLHRMLKTLPFLRFDEFSTPGTNGNGPHIDVKVAASRSLEYDIEKVSLRLDNLWPSEEISDPAGAAEVGALEAISLHGQSQFNDSLASHSLALRELTVHLVGLETIRVGGSRRQARPRAQPPKPVGDAIFLKFKQSLDFLEFNLTTERIHFDLNLNDLDERLATFGGVSGLLGVGSLVMSEDANRTMPFNSFPRKQRVERFDVGDQGELEAPSNLSNAAFTKKLNVRIGSVEAHISTTSGGVSCITSAIKFVQRPEICGLQVDQTLFSGPQTSASVSPGPKLEIIDLGVKFLPYPEESDLSRLLALLAPATAKFVKDDDLMVDTLLRQRRQGDVARASAGCVSIHFQNSGDFLALQSFCRDASKLSNLSKYIPDESRPGTLTIASVQRFNVRFANPRSVGGLLLEVANTELAHVASPLVLAFACKASTLSCPSGPPLMHILRRPMNEKKGDNAIVMRMIGDGVNPALRIQLSNVCMEFNPIIVGQLRTAFASGDFYDHGEDGRQRGTTQGHQQGAHLEPAQAETSLKLEVQFRDCGIGLSSGNHLPRGLLVVSDANYAGPLSFQDTASSRLKIQKATFWLTNECVYQKETTGISEASAHPWSSMTHIEQLSDHGYVTVSWISSADIKIGLRATSQSNSSHLVDAEIQNELIVIETCADSTQTLSQLFATLRPAASERSSEQQFQTEIASFEDMVASFTGEAFDYRPQSRGIDADSRETRDSLGLGDDYEVLGSGSHSSSSVGSLEAQMLGQKHSEKKEIISGGLRPASMDRKTTPNICKWDPQMNKFDPVSDAEFHRSPLVLRIHNINAVWNLHDGYDWASTRERVAKAIQNVQTKTQSHRQQPSSTNENARDDSVIDDFLFNSIYIGIPTNQEPTNITHEINQAIENTRTEHGSQVSNDPQKPADDLIPSRRGTPTGLHLSRSKRQKLTFDLRGVSADVVYFSAGNETESSMSLRIQAFEIFDHVPTSTWRKFVTYQQEAGPREETKPMVRLDVCAVRPVPTLTASELVLRATVLPLRLHVDQDALDFMTRFFEFRDDLATPLSGQQRPRPGPYLQRVEVRPVQIKLDYKPKKVDYTGLRSGRTKEFMNFFNLDAADIELRHVIVYGCPSFERLHQSLEDIWMPDIKSNQLPYILSGLNGVRTLVNVGDGFRNLLAIPVQEYRKDGRLIRSISKGAGSFLRTTGGEITRFGARLAAGASNALQGAENRLLVPMAVASPVDAVESGSTDSTSNNGHNRTHSTFADQPVGFFQGLRGAFNSLERDLLSTRDVIVAVSGEVRSCESAEDTARVVARHAPTLVLRPMIGATKAVSHTLLGATNSVDPANRQRSNDKYKQR